MAERIGRAVLDELGIEYGSVLPRDVGIAALTAMREPTEAMRRAGCYAMATRNVVSTPNERAIWRAMIDAALKPPASVG